ncbi:hypothetical protein [Mycolicibacterium sp. 120322]
MTAGVVVRTPAAGAAKRAAPVRLRSVLAGFSTLGWTVAGLVLASTAWSLVVATGRFPRQLFPSVPQILSAGHTL